MREDRPGRHEDPDRGIKPPLTVEHHNRAMASTKRGRHEHQVPIFKSSFVTPGKVWILPSDWQPLDTYMHPDP